VLLVDVNVLVYAFRQDATDHPRYARWLQELIDANSAFGLSDLVLSGFLRVVTHPGIFDPPSTIERAITFVEVIRNRPQCVNIVPGPRHWGLFTDFCRSTGATGNRTPDAYLAALAVESGCQWITTDRGFARYPGLRWRHPLE
jgi:uncharacterized protein